MLSIIDDIAEIATLMRKATERRASYPSWSPMRDKTQLH